MTDMDIEKEIVAKVKTAARVTPERIEAVISGEFYLGSPQNSEKIVR